MSRRSDEGWDSAQPSNHPQEPSARQRDASGRYDYEFLHTTDAEIVDRVRRAGADSREYADLSELLKESGFGALVNINKRDMLFQTLDQQLGIRVPRPPKSWPKDAYRVIFVSVCSAVSRFMRHQVLGGGWDPDGGATLRTFFVKASLYEFVTEYHKYYNEEEGSRGHEYCTEDVTLLVAHDQTFGSGAPPDPETTAENRDTVRRLLSHADCKLRKTLWLSAVEGRTHKEIAEELDSTDEAISSRIRRMRRKL